VAGVELDRAHAERSRAARREYRGSRRRRGRHERDGADFGSPLGAARAAWWRPAAAAARTPSARPPREVGVERAARDASSARRAPSAVASGAPGTSDRLGRLAELAHALPSSGTKRTGRRARAPAAAPPRAGGSARSASGPPRHVVLEQEGGRDVGVASSAGVRRRRRAGRRRSRRAALASGRSALPAPGAVPGAVRRRRSSRRQVSARQRAVRVARYATDLRARHPARPARSLDRRCRLQGARERAAGLRHRRQAGHEDHVAGRTSGPASSALRCSAT
jgi:hypothetical protein